MRNEMNVNDWIAAIVEAGLWYTFFYYLLYAIKTPVSLVNSAAILVVIMYAASIICPLLRETDAWKRLRKR